MDHQSSSSLSYGDRKMLNGVKEQVRSKILNDGIDLLQAFEKNYQDDSTRKGIMSQNLFWKSLLESGIDLSESYQNVVIKKFGVYNGDVKYLEFHQFLSLTPPDDYVDPELSEDRLPQPFRMIVKIMEESIIEAAWTMIDTQSAASAERRRKRVNMQTQSNPNGTDTLVLFTPRICNAQDEASNVRITCVYATEMETFVGTASGMISLFQSSETSIRVSENEIVSMSAAKWNSAPSYHVLAVVSKEPMTTEDGEETSKTQTMISFIRYDNTSRQFESLGRVDTLQDVGNIWIDASQADSSHQVTFAVTSSSKAKCLSVYRWSTVEAREDAPDQLIELKQLKLLSDVPEISFSEQGHKLLIAQKGETKVLEYHLTTNSERAIPVKSPITCFAHVTDSRGVSFLAIGQEDGTTMVWNVTQAKVMSVLRHQIVAVSLVQWIPNESKDELPQVLCICVDGSLRVYQIAKKIEHVSSPNSDREILVFGAKLISEIEQLETMDDRLMRSGQFGQARQAKRVWNTNTWVVLWDWITSAEQTSQGDEEQQENKRQCESKILMYDVAAECLLGQLHASEMNTSSMLLDNGNIWLLHASGGFSQVSLESWMSSMYPSITEALVDTNGENWSSMISRKDTVEHAMTFGKQLFDGSTIPQLLTNSSDADNRIEDSSPEADVLKDTAIAGDPEARSKAFLDSMRTSRPRRAKQWNATLTQWQNTIKL